MELTEENYYSHEADEEYMSVHQYLSFVGYMGVEGCEAKAMAKLKGEWVEEPTTAMIVGSYVDSYFEGTLEKFKEEHPEVFTQKGELKANFKLAEKMIARCIQDEVFMQYMSGEKQKIFTAEMFGMKWKCKLDSYIPGVAIVDLKTSKDIHKAWNVGDTGRVSFVEYWGYTLQLAVYQRIVEINTGDRLPCYIAVVTKEDSPEIKVIYLPQIILDDALNSVKMNIESVRQVKEGEVEPIGCGHCDYCKATEKLRGPISMDDLFNSY